MLDGNGEVSDNTCREVQVSVRSPGRNPYDVRDPCPIKREIRFQGVTHLGSQTSHLTPFRYPVPRPSRGGDDAPPEDKRVKPPGKKGRHFTRVTRDSDEEPSFGMAGRLRSWSGVLSRTLHSFTDRGGLGCVCRPRDGPSPTSTRTWTDLGPT